MRIISSKPVDISTVKYILEQREKEGELGYEQQQSLDYAKKFEKRDANKSEKLISEIMNKFEKITNDTAVKLVDVSPKNPESVRAILLKDRVELSESELTELMALLG